MPPREESSAPRRVLKNAGFLLGGQVLAAPLAIAVNAVIGRRLGAADLGYLYLASTISGFGFLLVGFGLATSMPAQIARDRTLAPALLGTTLAFRAAAAVVVTLVLFAVCALIGFDRLQLFTVALVMLTFAVGSLAGSCQDAIRGLERTDVAAAGNVLQQLLGAALVVPALLLGLGLAGALYAQLATAAIGLAGIALLLRPLGIVGVRGQRALLPPLLRAGAPFLFLGIALALQPGIDTVLLARLAPPEVVGWQAVAMKLLGPLLLPAGTLITSLYPTLSRLWSEDRAAYRQLAQRALRGTVALSIPLALCCAFYPDIGTRIFGREQFAPAEQNLRLLAPYILLCYLSMTLGCCLSAAGRQRAWAATQCGCVAISAALDPFLIPWFQARMHNGGIGVCTTMLVSEIGMMLAAALWLSPPGLFDRIFARNAAAALAAGLAMALASRLLSFANPFLAAPFALFVYSAFLILLGGVDRSELAAVQDAFARRWKRIVRQ